MIVPHVYQQELLDKLRDPSCPRFSAVIAPTGAGVRLPLEIRLREVAAESLGLVVVTQQVLAAQWAHRLEAAGVEPVVLLTGASAALGLLEERSAPGNGVIVTTYAATRHRLNRRALSEMEFGLVVHDLPIRPLSDEMEQINSRARRAVALIDRYDDAWAGWSLISNVTLQDLIDMGIIASTRFYYEETPHEHELRNAAVEVLKEYTSRFDLSLALTSDSLPALHSRLLAAVTRLSEQEELAERVWGILDRMDSLPAPDDSRLKALDRILERSLAAGERCIVVAPTTTDASYIAEHLTGTAKAPRAVITGSMTSDERQSALADAGTGECVVATTAVATPAAGWPVNTTLILWPSPINDRLLPDLAVPNPGVTVIELTEAAGHPG